MKSNIFITLLLLLSFMTPSLHPLLATEEAKPSVIPVRRGTIEGKLTWRGIVRSASRLEIRADKKLTLGKVHTNNYAPVKKGQLLIEVDTSEAQKKKRELKENLTKQNIDFETTKVKFKQATKNLNRKTILVENGVLALKELEEAQRDHKIMENEIKTKELEMQKVLREINLIETELKAANFVAPQEGVVQGLWEPALGSNEVTPGQMLATIIDSKSFALWVQVEETNLSLVEVGKESLVILDTAPETPIKGRIFEIARNPVDFNAKIKTYNMGISFQVQGFELKEGFAGEASLVYTRKDNALVVPLSAVKYLEGKNILVVERGTLGSRKSIPITLGIKTDTEAEILSGITELDKVVISE